MRKLLAPNRIAFYLGTIGAVATGLAPIVAELDLNDQVSIIASLAAITAFVDRFVKGQQKQEERDAWQAERDPLPDVSLVSLDEFDSEVARLSAWIDSLAKERDEPKDWDNRDAPEPAVSWDDHAVVAQEVGRLTARVEQLELRCRFTPTPERYR